jgi:uncharacterized protein
MTFRILSLDGGGIRGIVAAKMLAAIEKEINQPLNKYFNLIAGTSTGSILAAAIAVGRSSEEIVELYKEKSSVIFPYQTRFSLQRIPLLFQYGLSAPKFSNTGLIQVLKDVFKDTRLFDIVLPSLLVIAYDTIERKAIIFKNWRNDKEYQNVPLWEVCLCSASAPTYFPAHKLQKIVRGTVKDAGREFLILDETASSLENLYQNHFVQVTDAAENIETRNIIKYVGASRQAWIDSPWEKIPDKNFTYSIKTIYSAIDGGVAANNPSTCAVAEALRFGYKPEEISVLSIGTGERTRVISYEKAEHWGLIEWAQPIIGVLFDGSSDIYEYITDQIMGNRILRLQFKLDRQLTNKRLSDDIDDISQENIYNLMEAADTYINQPSTQKALREFLLKSQ